MNNRQPVYRNLLLEHQLCFALYSATNAITRAYKTELRQAGLTYPQYLVMLVLWEQDGLSVGAIGRKLKLDSGTLTPLLKRLEKAGWLSRQRDLRDERTVNISLTGAGQNLQEMVATSQENVACQTGLDDVEFEQLKQTLNNLTESIIRNQPGVENAA